MTAMESEKSLKSYEAIDMSDPFDRSSFCIGTTEMEGVIQLGDPRFRATLKSAFVGADSKGLEETFNLKQKLRSATTFDFWQILMEDMTEITGAQYAFVAKRVLEDDEYSAVEMPEYGERGSCLMGLAFYFNDHKGASGLHRDFKYKVYGCPCQWMKHDKVLLIPEGLKALTPDNPNAGAFPILPEGYLAVPLFHKGKCFAHMGVMWTEEGLKERSPISWAMLEMFLHALEDQVTARILEGEGFGPKVENEVIPNDAVSSSLPSLKPYARSLSHELRTPMQGVVGMLDVMYASVLEATEWEAGDMRQIRDMVESLKESIEVAQDSSKRAVDAADNMVHAYDFDMEVPSTPKMASQVPPDLPGESDAALTPMQDSDFDPSTPRVTPRQSSKRRRESGSPEDMMPHKVRHRSEGLDHDGDGDEILGPPLLPRSRSHSPPSYAGSPARLLMPDNIQRRDSSGPSMASAASPSPSGAWLFDAAGKIQLNSRPLKIRELLSQILHETLRSGGRPDSTRSSLTPEGEKIIVSTMGPGEVSSTVEIELKVDERVPETLVVDGNALTKLLSSVFHNAVKFTGNGGVSVAVGVLNATAPQVLFSITDTGEGIPGEFLPRLFKAFSREDASMTRQRDGLGLGLLVAKGIARKMGGDLWCQRTSTDGPDKGSEFRVRLPLTLADASSTPGTPVVDPNTPAITPPLSMLPNPLSNWSLDISRQSPFANPSPLHEERFPSPPPLQPLPPTSDSTPPSITPQLPPDPQPINLVASPTRSTTTPTTAITTVTTTPTTPRRPPPKLPYDKTLATKIPLSILVAEDNKINRKLLTSMLRKLGYTDISEACDGQEAVEIMSSPRHPPIDVVLMDLWMPRMDGYEATKRILESRGRGSGRGNGFTGVTVLAVSADATQAAMVKTSSVGMKGFMSKPYKIVDLERLIVEFCGADGEQ